jgi:hypothetical protein
MCVCLQCAGVLSCLDGYMNIALEQTEEHVNGVVTNRYGDAFIRGNNGKSFKDIYMAGCVLMCCFIQVLYISAAEPL